MPPVKQPVVVPEAPKAPTTDFVPLWGSKWYDKIGKKVWKEDKSAPFGDFTFEDTTPTYNPTQFATQETADKIISMLRKLMPDTYIIGVDVGPEFFMPCIQKSVKINSETHNLGAFADEIMFNNWEYWKYCKKQVFESQGVRINTSLTWEEAFGK